MLVEQETVRVYVRGAESGFVIVNGSDAPLVVVGETKRLSPLGVTIGGEMRVIVKYLIVQLLKLSQIRASTWLLPPTRDTVVLVEVALMVQSDGPLFAT